MDSLDVASLRADDLDNPQVKRRLEAVKRVSRLAGATKHKALAATVLRAHRQEALTLVIRNTVKDAVATWLELAKALVRQNRGPELVLLHSRFRPADRKNHLGRALAPLAPEGRIIVSTQVVEAGIDISAATLFTDIAPWPSLAQRFGRCNRHGERASADIYWIDRELTAACARRPYSEAELATARHRLLELEDALPGTLPKTEGDMEVRQDLRKQDMLNLFDTTPDLAGEDVARLSLHPLLGRPERLCVLAGLRPAEWQPVRPASTVS